VALSDWECEASVVDRRPVSIEYILTVRFGLNQPEAHPHIGGLKIGSQDTA
jgi:hypothetical protein